LVRESNKGCVTIAPNATKVQVHRDALSHLWILLIRYATIGATTKANNKECVGHLWKNIACIGSLYSHGPTKTSRSGIVPNAIPHRYAFLPNFFHPIKPATPAHKTHWDILSIPYFIYT